METEVIERQTHFGRRLLGFSESRRQYSESNRGAQKKDQAAAKATPANRTSLASANCILSF